MPAVAQEVGGGGRRIQREAREHPQQRPRCEHRRAQNAGQARRVHEELREMPRATRPMKCVLIMRILTFYEYRLLRLLKCDHREKASDNKTFSDDIVQCFEQKIEIRLL